VDLLSHSSLDLEGESKVFRARGKGSKCIEDWFIEDMKIYLRKIRDQEMAASNGKVPHHGL
jgi:hypothetical protein